MPPTSSVSIISSVTRKAPVGCCGLSGVTRISSITSCQSDGAGLRINDCPHVTPYSRPVKSKGQHQPGLESIPHGRPAVLFNPAANPAAAREYGFNSAFEEFALALELARNGVKMVYPRAIYMTGTKGAPSRAAPEERRYKALASLLTPEGEPVTSAAIAITSQSGETGMGLMNCWPHEMERILRQKMRATRAPAKSFRLRC